LEIKNLSDFIDPIALSEIRRHDGIAFVSNLALTLSGRDTVPANAVSHEKQL
jgi:hypothetical protein